MDRTAGAAAICGLLMLATGCNDVPGGAPDVESSAPNGPTSVDAGALTLAFGGDVHFEKELRGLLATPEKGLGPIGATLGGADIAMVNLETAVTGPRSTARRDPKEWEEPGNRYWFRTTPAAFDVLSAAGVDVVTMANNHAADFGEAGLEESLLAASSAPVTVVGIGENLEAALAPYRVSVDGTTVALFAADASFREGSSSAWAAGDGPGIASARSLDDSGTRALLAGVRAAADDGEAAIVYLHWGTEYVSCPDDYQRRLVRELADAGAAAVVGTHVHRLQPMGWLGDTYVGYGLSNFAWYHDHSSDTGVLRLTVTGDRVTSGAWLPARIGADGLPHLVSGPAARGSERRLQRLDPCSDLSRERGASAEPAPVAYPASIRPVTPELRREFASSMRPGCPVPWSRLRLLELPYVDFDGRDQRGLLIVAERYAADVVEVFGRLHQARWPIHSMRPVSEFGSDDDRSMAADNTSGFNCRRVAGSTSWSAHAFGAAIDLNPVENPYVYGETIRPPTGAPYAPPDRALVAVKSRSVIRPGDPVTEAFAAIGWEWGGTWSDPDYQHFQAADAFD